MLIFIPAIGFTDEKMWLYLAEDLVKTKQSLDADEFLELFPTKLDDAVKMVWSGQITDVKTIIGILWAQRIIYDKVDMLRALFIICNYYYDMQFIKR